MTDMELRPDDIDVEDRWIPFQVTAKYAEGEMREQQILARDAGHALERACEPTIENRSLTFGTGWIIEIKAVQVDVLEEKMLSDEHKAEMQRRMNELQKIAAGNAP